MGTQNEKTLDAELEALLAKKRRGEVPNRQIQEHLALIARNRDVSVVLVQEAWERKVDTARVSTTVLPASAARAVRSDYFMDIANSNICYQFDPQMHSLTKVDLKAIAKAHPGLQIKPPILAQLVYNPFEVFWSIAASDSEYTKLNLFQPPSWRRDSYFTNTEVSFVARMPIIYVAFFEHLFDGDQASINYVVNWLAAALKQKNSTFLCLVGSNRGIGKNTLTDILDKIFGSSNSQMLKQAFLQKEFNASVKNTQFAVLDETSIKTEQAFANAKMYTNKRIALEGKGVDSGTTEIHTNFLLSNNETDCLVGVEMVADRQFSVPSITKTKLDDSAFIANYSHEQLRQKENVDELGRFLWHYKADLKEANRIFRSDHYYEIIRSSKPEWQNVILEDMNVKLEGRLLSSQQFKDILKSESGMNVGRDKIKAFLNSVPKLFYYFEKKRGTATKRWILVRSAEATEDEWSSKIQSAMQMRAEELEECNVKLANSYERTLLKFQGAT